MGSSLEVEEGRRHEKVAANYYQPMYIFTEGF